MHKAADVASITMPSVTESEGNECVIFLNLKHFMLFQWWQYIGNEEETSTKQHFRP
jgi:hypothetical protein